MDIKIQFENAVKNLGFRSEREYFYLTSKVNLKDERTKKKFRSWQYRNGTKDRLKKIIGGQPTKSE